MPRGPIAQGVVDMIRLIGRAIVGRNDANGKMGSKMSRAERKTQGAAETARSAQELRAGSSVIGAAALLVVAMFVLEARGGSNVKAAQPIDSLTPTDTEALRAALFGAAPWIIECTGQSGRSLLNEAAAERLLPDGVRAASLDCAAPMASGTSLLERFKLTPAASPTALPLLLQAGHGQASPVALGRHTSASSLARHLKRWAEPDVPLVNSTLDLRRYCLSRPSCLLLLTSGTAPQSAKKAVLKAVGSSLRDVGLATLNRKTHSASLTAQLPPTRRPVLMALRETSPSALVTEARAFQGIVSAEGQLELDAFVSTATAKASGTQGSGSGFVQLEVPPRVVPADARPGVGSEMSHEELYDPLLSRKRYEQETSL